MKTQISTSGKSYPDSYRNDTYGGAGASADILGNTVDNKKENQVVKRFILLDQKKV